MIKEYLIHKPAKSKGLGIFTIAPIQENVMIECSPVLVLKEADRLHIDKTALHDYIFEWKANGENLICVAWGYLSLYNHSYKSNAEYCMDYETGTMSITSVREIQAGEEITINYNGDWNDATKIWFETLEGE